jgi:hypothetical protein
MRSRSAAIGQFRERTVGATDDGKATGVAADVGISASAELRTIVAASSATTDRKTCRIIESRRGGSHCGFIQARLNVV